MSDRIRWGAVVGAVLLAEVVLVGAAFAWVALYSHVIAPGQTVADYQAYALRASPWVSVILGVPLFYLLARYWLRERRTGWTWIGAYLLLDAILLLALGAGTLPFGMVALSYSSKGLAGWLGLRHARR